MTERNVDPERAGIRHVSDVHAAWTEGTERGAYGAFTIQLILSDGAEEYVLRPTADDAKVHLKLLGQSEVTYFDTNRQVLIPSSIK